MSQREVISTEEIRRKCALPTTYGRGRTLYDSNCVCKLHVKKSGPREVTFESTVEGSAYQDFETSLMIVKDEITKNLVQTDCYCECGTFFSRGGFCNHLCATAFKINELMEWGQLWDLMDFWKIGDHAALDEESDVYETEVADDYRSTKTNAKDLYQFSWKDSSVQEPVMKKEILSSSQNLLEIINSVALQDRNRFCQELSGGNVELEPTLHLDYEEERVDFRVGMEQMYVVKDVEQFVNMIRKQEYFEYGKKLAFVHTQSAFTKESLDLITMLLREEQMNHANYYYRKQRDKRFWELGARQLEELLEHYEGKFLWVENCVDLSKRKTAIVRENPYFPVEITHQENTNYAKITFPEIILLEGVNHLYLWWKDTIYMCSDEYSQDMRELLRMLTQNTTRAEREQSSQYYFYNPKARDSYFLMKEEDYASFCATVLPLLQKYTDLDVQGLDFEQYQVEDGSYEVFLDVGKNHEIICDVQAIYGEHTHNLVHLPSMTEQYRDIRTEYELRTLLEQYFNGRSKNGEQYVLSNDDDRLAAFVEYGVKQLQEMASIFATEAFGQIKIATKTSVAAGLSIKGNLLHVTWDVKGMSKEELNEILNSYKRKKKYHRLRNGELLNIANSGLDVIADLQEDLQLTKAQFMDGEVEVPIYRALYLNALMKDNADKIAVSKDEMFETLMEQFESFKDKEYGLPKDINAQLRPYQVEGYEWACGLAELGFGGILADDMGLGKTLQMITYLSAHPGMTHLVVCPASLVYNWEAEFSKFAPHLSVCVMIGTAAVRQELISEYENYDVVITSYDLLKRDIKYYANRPFGCEIIDEAQYIKNAGTQAAKAVKAIDSKTRFALTGTPIENRLSELWSIFDYLMPGYLYSYKYFKQHFEEQIVLHTDSEAKAVAKVQTMIGPFLLRRLKKDVLKDLPDKLEEVVYAKFDQEQDKLYRATEKKIIDSLEKKSKEEVKEDKLQVLAELTKLRQICCDPTLYFKDYKHGSAKLDTCLDLIESALDGGHKILLFSQFATMLEIIAKRLRERGIRHFLLRGSTSKRARRDMVDRFQNGEAEVFLISLKAGGTGLNLTAADVVIHYDPWWNVAAQNQATDRSHRIGQENAVTVYKLIMRNTVEERILHLQDLKKELAEHIISAEGVSFAEMSKEDILQLFV